MSIRIEIIADTFSQMIQDLGGVVKMFIPVPAEAAEQPAAMVDPPVEAEVIDPPKKPRGRPPQVKVIDAEANPITVDPAPDVVFIEPGPAPKVLDFEKDLRPAIVAYVNDMSDPANPGSKKSLFDALVAEFKVARASEIPTDQYQAVLDYIKAKRAAGK